MLYLQYYQFIRHIKAINVYDWAHITVMRAVYSLSIAYLLSGHPWRYAVIPLPATYLHVMTWSWMSTMSGVGLFRRHQPLCVRSISMSPVCT